MTEQKYKTDKVGSCPSTEKEISMSVKCFDKTTLIIYTLAVFINNSFVSNYGCFMAYENKYNFHTLVLREF